MTRERTAPCAACFHINTAVVIANTTMRIPHWMRTVPRYEVTEDVLEVITAAAMVAIG